MKTLKYEIQKLKYLKPYPKADLKSVLRAQFFVLMEIENIMSHYFVHTTNPLK